MTEEEIEEILSLHKKLMEKKAVIAARLIAEQDMSYSDAMLMVEKRIAVEMLPKLKL